ncbi:MAG: hypothetical protein AB7O44_15475 [Hyphomicrobiaceae bacterium]
MVVGANEDSEEITSCVVVPVEISAATKHERPPKLSNSEQIALLALQYAIAEVGVKPPALTHVPQGEEVRVVTREQWLDYARRHGISDSEARRVKNQAFKRAAEGLIAKGRVGFWEPLAWLA